jgi:hypothetical protein
MKNPKFRGALATALAAVFGFPSMGFAWWGFVHYRIAKDIVGVDPNYAMGPDTFVARTSFYNISPEFTWSHAAMATDLDVLPPELPQYPHDGRYPGKVMYDLVTKKLRPTTMALMQGTEAHEQSPIDTAIGFLVHNASDNVVHWDYFLGGPTSIFCTLDGHGPQWMWETNHGFKEEWASYIVLMLKDARTNGGAGTPIELFQGPGGDGILGTSDDIFSCLTEDANDNGILDSGEDQDGNGVLTDYTDDVFGPKEADGTRRLQSYLRAINPIAFETNVKLQHLAMKAYRKNRRNTDISGVVGSGSESSEFVVAGSAEIASSFSSEILSGAAGMNELANMSYARLMELNSVASDVNASGVTTCLIPRWHPADVMVRFQLSVIRGTAWLVQAEN